jgi:hypothetical protein
LKSIVQNLPLSCRHATPPPGIACPSPERAISSDLHNLQRDARFSFADQSLIYIFDASTSDDQALLGSTLPQWSADFMSGIAAPSSAGEIRATC